MTFKFCSATLMIDVLVHLFCFQRYIQQHLKRMRIQCTQASLVLEDSVNVLNGAEVKSPHTLRITALKKTFNKKMADNQGIT